MSLYLCKKHWESINLKSPILITPDMQEVLSEPRPPTNKERKRLWSMSRLSLGYVSKARRAAIETTSKVTLLDGSIGVMHGMIITQAKYERPKSLWERNKELYLFNKRKKQKRQRTGRR